MIDRSSDIKWISVASKLQETKDKIKFLESEKSKLSKLLQELSEFKDSCGGGFEFKTEERAGTINYKDIPELRDVDLSRYRGVGISYWKLVFKKQFEEIL